MFNRCILPRITVKDTPEEVPLGDKGPAVNDDEKNDNDEEDMRRSKREVRQVKLRDLERWGQGP